MGLLVKNKSNQSKTYSHDCSSNKLCNQDWGILGCIKLYNLKEIEQRMNFLTEKKLCLNCGYELSDHNKKNFCPKDRFYQTMPVRCKFKMKEKDGKKKQCLFAAAVCPDHSSNNARPELLDWINSKNIRTSVSSVVYNTSTNNKDPIFNQSLPVTQQTFSKEERNKLQKGQLSANLSNDQLKEYFQTNEDGSKRKSEVIGIPDGQVCFIFCKIQGKKNGIQCFIDNGCNCCIFRDSVPETELEACKLKAGPINIDVATGITVHATGEWGALLPLANGQKQVVRGLSVPQVTSKFPILQLRQKLDEVKYGAPKNKDLQKIQIPETLAGHGH